MTADWHIKLGQKNVPKQWQINRYKMLFNKIAKLQSKVDLIVIAGDIFDKVPTLEELELFFDFIPLIDTETIIFDGNHEATKRGETFLHHLYDLVYRLNSKVLILKESCNIYHLDFIPYTNIKTFDPSNFISDVLFTHVRGKIEPYVLPEINLDKLNRWKTVLAGDLHSYSNSQRNILYPGSPLSTTFHRSKINNGVIIFDTNDHTHEWIDLKLPQLLRLTVSSEKDIIEANFDFIIYDLKGDIKELSKVDNKLINKKILKTKPTKTLDLYNKSIPEELKEYLSSILKLKDHDIKKVLSEYHAIEKDL